ncbi:leucyl aminopeptidase family protein [Methylobacterium radiotolerans]|uniref:Leucyl aminopeptidase n=1 Tax=Methylobacterium radiotolerans (strain ATCC 27329 / DSM 1819 / JCM 2831 / NBRC 15690 / NCIMB 10815 / 0-1) TaxID=426355 RepID=B1LUX2_METRJ|nr:leucyl aminopeptidase family protein [Methylobacterium radiotolerans]ACB25558.1 Leucyl aminopeptidase [Methylobacterium radiotolerans JCM 2831]GEM97278.1 aminopeptidase [Methylobacterium radiotolerans]
MTQAEIPATTRGLLPGDTQAVPVTLVTTGDWAVVESGLEPAQRSFAQAIGFTPKAGSLALLPGPDGSLARVLFGLGDPEAANYDRLLVGKLPGLLPEGIFRLENAAEPHEAALAWLMGSYRFGRYRSGGGTKARLAAPAGIDVAEVERIAAAVALGRDLVNTPANDLGPAEIEAAARALGDRHGATVTVTEGAALAEGYPLIHAVGAASPRAPRLIDLTWGPADAPRVTLVGKGVAFDTGGLDLKPSAAMLLMKKDMGGAAAALAAADMVMGAGLTLRLRLLIPAVENAVAGNAFRPGDVLPSRAGLSVEIGNTDAEGRLILADALALADADAPELILDFSTLTGAARVALGPDLPAFFTEDDALAEAVARAGRTAIDPVWRMPLHAPYASLLDSKVADLNNVSGGPFAGAITAALFLRRFAPNTRAHGHFDLYGWNPSTKPGRPEGGEVQTARLTYALLKARYGG